MSTRFRLLFILLGAVLVAAIYTFPIWQPFVIPAKVETGGEVFPGLAPQLQPTFQALPPAEQNAYRALAQQNAPSALAMINAALSFPTEVPLDQQALPDMTGPVIVATGEFTRIDPVRWAIGTVTVYEQADGRKVLRFERFSAINGPELHVILSTSEAPQTRQDVVMNDMEIDLGNLIGTIGDQNYEIPAEINMSEYRSVVLFSQTINLVYSFAPLTRR